MTLADEIGLATASHEVVTIALVDDTEQNRYTIGRYLRRAGFAVWEGSTGADALRLAQKRPELIVLDVKLPDMIGYEVCRRIKSNPATASIPVLHTSATFLESQDRVEGLECGADAYLTAPIKPEELIATVRALLRIRQAEKKAELASSQWQSTFDAIGSGVCLINQHGKIERCNAAMAALAGRPIAEIVGSPFDEFAAHVSIPMLAYTRMLDTLHRETLETQIQGGWWRTMVDPVFDASGGLDGAVCIVADVSERKRSEAQIRRSQANLTDFLENAPIGVYWLNSDGVILRTNKAALEMLGYASDEFIGCNISEFFVSADHATNKLQRLRYGETIHDEEVRMRCKDGRVRELVLSSNVYWEDGQFVYTRSFVRDISERKRAERRMRIQYEAARILSESGAIRDGAAKVLQVICESAGWKEGVIWQVDVEQSRAVFLEEWRSPDLRGRASRSRSHPATFAPGTDLPEFLGRCEAAWVDELFGEPSDDVFGCVALAVPICLGEKVMGLLEFYSEELPPPDPELLKVLQAIGHQIALFMDRKLAADSLAAAQEDLQRHAAELELRVEERTRRLQESNQELESFSYTLAHDLRGPLRSIEGFTRALIDDYAQAFDDNGRDYAARIVSAAQRMDQLIQDLLEYGRISQADVVMDWLDLREACAMATVQFRKELAETQVQLQIREPGIRIWAHALLLEQILANLIGNALKFGRPDTPLVIEIAARDFPDFVRVTVRDNGIGIDPQYQERIFKIFERLVLGEVPGTGIGLAIVKRAVERMGGRVGVESDPGDGSCFWFELPKPGRPPLTFGL